MKVRRHRLVAGSLTLFALVATTVASLQWVAEAQDGRKGGHRPRPVPAAASGDEPVAQIELHDDVAPGETAPVAPTLAPATPLSEEDAQKVLARLAPLAPEPGSDFALREGSLPAPRTGAKIAQAFPPTEETAPPKPETAPAGPLEVVRHQPDGEVPLAPHVSLTFSQPMVAVTSHEATVAAVPVKISPEVEGAWRWVGTKTLLFEPKPRFPMATNYTVEVREGTASAIGGTLTSKATFKFATPPVTLRSSWPQGGPHGLTPLFFASFDQAIEGWAVLATTKLTDGKGESYSLQLATDTEIEADAQVSSLARGAEKGRWLAFRAVKTLPADSQCTVTIGPGTPSAEGPRTTTTPQTFTFHTYGPLKLVNHWPQGEAPPYGSFSLQFSNPLDAKAHPPEGVVGVEPALARQSVAFSGDYMTVSGAAKARTTYTITVGADLTDVFGQKLGHDETVAFKVGSMPASFWGSQGLVVLDPAGPRSYSVWSVNESKLKVRAYAVTPEQWAAFNALNTNWWRNRKLDDVPGKCVVEDTITPAGDSDVPTETRVDLAGAFEEGLGHAIVIIEPTEQPKELWQRQAIIAWVESTRIAVDAFVDHETLLAWTTTLLEGRPVEGAALTVAPWGTTGISAADGTASIKLAPDTRVGAILVARKGKDSALLPEQLSWWGNTSQWYARKPTETLRWYVASDRHLYRPGEEVHLKGWLRLRGAGPTGDLEPIGNAAKTVHYTLRDSRGNEVVKGDAALSTLGGWDAAWKLPPTMNLGGAWLQLEAKGGRIAGSSNASIEVQEFRRPEFEVQASASAGPHVVGGHATVTVSASYYAGGGLPNAEVTWNVTATQGSFTPPNRGDYSFGVWVPWWESWGGSGESSFVQHVAHTDASGKHTLGIDLRKLKHPRPVVISAAASVADVNRQAWAASASLLVHPASEYVGLKSDRTFVQKGEPLNVDAIVADLDGALVAGRRIDVRAVRLEWDYSDGNWKQIEADPFETTLTSSKEPARATFTPKEGGTYKVRARIVDDKDRANESELTLWVAGGKSLPVRNLQQEAATLIPDKRSYQPGETAEILLQSPFSPAEAIVSVEREGFLKTERLSLDGPSATIKVRIEPFHTPNVRVRVDLVGQAERMDDAGKPDPKLPKRPAFAAGELNLPVPPVGRKLALEVKPRDAALAPGSETEVAVTLKNAKGEAVVGGEVAVIAVDESVLALSGYRLPDALSAFYLESGGGVAPHYLRAHVLLANPADALKQAQEHASSTPDINGNVDQAFAGAAPGGAPPPAPQAKAMRAMAGKESADHNESEGGGAQPIAVRADFNALALFAAELPTDASGAATVKLKLPDSLTRYRLMAIGVGPSGQEFGQGESSITARLPLMVRPSAPRFLNFGDRFELPVVVQNQTESALEVDVAVRASNCAITGAKGLRVKVPANDRVEVRFPAAAERAGKARFQIGAVSGSSADASEVTLPVWTPATTEAFATYGELDEGAVVQPVSMPGKVVKEFGGLEVETSSTALQALTDAVLYLVAYPFECSEQLSSRVLAIAALKDVLGAFHAEGLPSADEMTAAVNRDIERLHQIQDYDGSFGFWRRGENKWPYLSIHVAHALARAKAKGFVVPDEMLQRSHQYLKNVEAHIPPHYGKEYRRALVAYALSVRKRLGDVDVKKAHAVVADGGLETLPLEAAGWILSVLSGQKGSEGDVAAIRKHLENRVSEEAGTAHWTTGYADGQYLLLASDRRTDGVVLEALIQDSPKSDIIPKVVRGLLAHRKAGRWGNTQENAFVLLALDTYFNTYEKETPDFVAKAWLGDRYAGEHAFKGRSTDRVETKVPMSYLASGPATQDLTIAKEGTGRLYYRIGMRYAPASLQLEPFDHGFTVATRRSSTRATSSATRKAPGTCAPARRSACA